MTDKITPTPLEERMRLHTPGQLTWPEPQLKQWCSNCSFFDDEATTTKGKGRCDLVEAHQGVKGALFAGAEAIACHKFQRGKL